MHAHDLTVDVAGIAGVPPGAAEVAVTVHIPDDLPATRPVVAFAFPGGGYARRYWSMDFPDVGAAGQAGFHVARGWVFVTVDHLQVGDSTTYDPDVLTLEAIAAANAHVVTTVLERLASGSVGGAPAIVDPVRLGVGQSMGGCLLIVQQAHHRTFDAIAVLGYSGIHTVVPARPGAPPVPLPWIARVGFPENPIVLAPPPAVPVDETPVEHPWTWAFHDDSEPRDLVHLDMAPPEPGSAPPWRSVTTPACAILMVAPGVVAAEAASITSPVFIGVGVTDVVPQPWMEPMAYRSSTDVTLAVFPRMAHMHNFAPTRTQLWARLHGWASAIASLSAG